nr:hypothetical protein GCM10025730_33440 [Promicromonospora thailandica]
MSPTDRTPLLTARGIEKSFGANHVLRGVDLDVRRGDVVALIGASGSGKTTVLRSLNGLETPDAGVLELAGGPVVDFGAQAAAAGPGWFGNRTARAAAKANRAALRDRSAMVFQHHNLFPHRTVLENVIEGPCQVQGCRARRRPAVPRSCWRASGSRRSGTRTPTSCRAGSSSASASCGRSRCSRTCCCSTSRRRPSTPSWSARC